MTKTNIFYVLFIIISLLKLSNEIDFVGIKTNIRDSGEFYRNVALFTSFVC